MAPLVVLVAVAVAQVALLLHLQASLTTAAAEGARAAALAGSDPRAGERRAREVAADVLSADAGIDVDVRRTRSDGLDVIVVALHADPELVGLLPVGQIDVSARALVEGSRP